MQTLQAVIQHCQSDALRTRAIATSILTAFYHSPHRPLDTILHHTLGSMELSSRDKRFITELVYGTVRWQKAIDFLLNPLYTPPSTSRGLPVRILLRLAMYQLLWLDSIPAYAAIDTTVELSKHLVPLPFSRLINAVLRSAARRYGTTTSAKELLVSQPLTIRYSVPEWLVQLLEIQYPTIATAILEAWNHRPRFGIRRNSQKVTQHRFQQWLASQGISAQLWPFNAVSYLLPTVFELQQTIEYRQGWFSLQDPAAATVVELATPHSSDTILDACAAPGGKTGYLAELTNDQATIIALEVNPSRYTLLRETLTRLQLQSTTPILQSLFDHQPDIQYDLIILDVPCSDLGTIAKHPDIKWRKRRKQLRKLQQLQRRMLRTAASLLKTGGTLIYSTCTINYEENEDNIDWFLQNFPNFRCEPATEFLPYELCDQAYLKILPHHFNTDATFAARLRKL